jgi:hypothetical protein
VSPVVGVDAVLVNKRKSLSLAENPKSSAVQPVAIPTELSRLPISGMLTTKLIAASLAIRPALLLLSEHFRAAVMDWLLQLTPNSMQQHSFLRN